MLLRSILSLSVLLAALAYGQENFANDTPDDVSVAPVAVSKDT